MSSKEEREAELLRLIATAIPADLQRERDKLWARRRSFTPADEAEFLRLTNAIETAQAERIMLIAALADLRGADLRETAIPFSGEAALLRRTTRRRRSGR
jgi:hypothetical protein